MQHQTADSFDDLRTRIADTRETMPKRLAQAAGFVLAHPDDMALGTAASIAKAADVQPSTLVRLAHHLGYEGFSDLQTVFRDRLKSRASSYEERLAALENGLPSETHDGSLLNGFLLAARQSLDALTHNINPMDFARAVAILSAARAIYLIARRRSYPLTAHMSYACSKLGIQTIMVNSTNGIDSETVAMASRTDAAIICSFAPYAPETVSMAETLSDHGVPIVAITDSAMSPLCKHASIWLEVSESDFAGFRSISASMAVAAALPVAIADRRRHTKKN